MTDLDVTTQVVAEQGRWTVYLVVTSPEGVERRRLDSWPTEAKARLAADVVRRSAARRRPPREEPGDRPD